MPNLETRTTASANADGIATISFYCDLEEKDYLALFYGKEPVTQTNFVETKLFYMKDIETLPIENLAFILEPIEREIW